MKHKKSFKKNYCATETALMQCNEEKGTKGKKLNEEREKRKIAKVSSLIIAFFFFLSFFVSISTLFGIYKHENLCKT